MYRRDPSKDGKEKRLGTSDRKRTRITKDARMEKWNDNEDDGM